MNRDVVVVAGGGGFIGGHLVGDLLAKGYTRIRAVDIKPLDLARLLDFVYSQWLGGVEKIVHR